MWLEHGGASSWVTTAALQDELSKTYRVCGYSRAGYGWSQVCSFPHRAAVLVAPAVNVYRHTRRIVLCLHGAGSKIAQRGGGVRLVHEVCVIRLAAWCALLTMSACKSYRHSELKANRATLISSVQGGPRPRTEEQQALEARLLMQALQEPPPYVFIGHSNGGQLVQRLATESPESTAAVVALDSVPIENWCAPDALAAAHAAMTRSR